MTSTKQAEHETKPLPADGGVPARRAVVRWAWRLFRRQWRSQALVLALLTLAVAAAVGGATAAYNLAPAAGNAEFGSANHALRFEDPDPGSIATDVAAADDWFDAVDVISRRFVSVAGLFEPVEFRAQDPAGHFAQPMLALVEGRYPATSGEVAVTDGVGEIFEVAAGDTLQYVGETWSVVGLVENPSDLGDEFALVAPSHGGTPDELTLVVGGSDDQLLAFRPPSGATPESRARPANEGAMAAVAILTAATVLLLLVSLVAAAGFAVIAQRRLRQLGMLAAIGATEKHMRLVTVSGGAVIGVIAAILGATIGLLGWVMLVPSMESAVGHRIDRLAVPWWLIGSSMALAVLTATAAAWWPARAVARTPIVSALSGRPSRPQRARRNAAVVGPLFAVAVVCLLLADNPPRELVDTLPLVAGIVALILGVIWSAPLAIRVMARLATPLSVSIRLAFRDLVRYQSRSGAALAATSLAVGIAVAIVISASAALFDSAAEGNLGDHQIMVRIGELPASGDVEAIPDRTPAEVQRLEDIVAEIADSLENTTTTPIEVAIDPEFEGLGGLASVVLTEEVEPGLGRILTHVYVAGPELLDLYDVEFDSVDTDIELLTVEKGEVRFEPMSPEIVTSSEQLTPSYSSLPGSFIMPAALASRRWDRAPAAWLIESGSAIDDDQFQIARGLAAQGRLTLEVRDDQTDLATLRTGATAAGALVALGILAMTVGLIRSEAEGDLRTLTATGATSRIRRTLTAATAGGLAFLGSILGIGGAYLGYIAGYATDLGALTPVPTVHLAAIVIGLPSIAVVGGLLLGGHEPRTISRQPIE